MDGYEMDEFSPDSLGCCKLAHWGSSRASGWGSRRLTSGWDGIAAPGEIRKPVTRKLNEKT